MRASEAPSADTVRRALVETLGRERLRVVATLIRVTGDWGLAEDAVADAVERALRTWPRDGVPASPGAWLTTTARRRAIDVLRRAGTERAALSELEWTARGESPRAGGPIADDRLRLVFTCCHPALVLPSRVALTLTVVCGLPTRTVAGLFLVSEATMGQRLLRAKQRIAGAGIPYQVPGADMLAERLDGVLGVVYLVFTSGWAAAVDDAPAVEAIRLGRVLCGLLPESDEARALLALLLLQHSRRDARTVDGELVTLEAQDRRRWDQGAIAEGRQLLARPATSPGRYRLQAEIAAVHARAVRAQDTDWPAVRALYDALSVSDDGPVIALNRAIAVGMADGPEAGLAQLDALRDDRVLRDLHLLPAARGDLLARAGRYAEAVAALDRAAELAPTDGERVQLDRRRTELATETGRTGPCEAVAAGAGRPAPGSRGGGRLAR